MPCAFSISQSWWTVNAAGLTDDMLQDFKSDCIPYPQTSFVAATMSNL
jgi:hypothetical protein